MKKILGIFDWFIVFFSWKLWKYVFWHFTMEYLILLGERKILRSMKKIDHLGKVFRKSNEIMPNLDPHLVNAILSNIKNEPNKMPEERKEYLESLKKDLFKDMIPKTGSIFSDSKHYED